MMKDGVKISCLEGFVCISDVEIMLMNTVFVTHKLYHGTTRGIEMLTNFEKTGMFDQPLNPPRNIDRLERDPPSPLRLLRLIEPARHLPRPERYLPRPARVPEPENDTCSLCTIS